jgi:signal transduction histidine kinase
MEKHNVRFVFNIPGNVAVNFDPFILDAISRNLIDNAIKYSPDSGNIFITYTEGEALAEISIRDTGPGMSATQSANILNNTGKGDCVYYQNRKIAPKVYDPDSMNFGYRIFAAVIKNSISSIAVG